MPWVILREPPVFSLHWNPEEVGSNTREGNPQQGMNGKNEPICKSEGKKQEDERSRSFLSCAL